MESICEVPLLGLLLLRKPLKMKEGQIGENIIIRASGLQRAVLGNSGDIPGLQWSVSGAILEYYYFELFHEEYLEVARKFQRYC